MNNVAFQLFPHEILNNITFQIVTQYISTTFNNDPLTPNIISGTGINTVVSYLHSGLGATLVVWSSS
ncbi:MAG: hypothetical protein IPN87_06385 [Saprospiraceae bacterium]|nr:hypothetical protein [Candidatus Brachybacter algidus]